MSAACCCRTISEKHKSARQLLSTALGPTGTCRRPAQPDDAATGIAGLLPNVHAISRGRRNFARWPVHSMTRATNPSRTMSTYAARSASRREQWQDAMHHCPLSPLMNTLNTTPAGVVSEDSDMTGRPGTVWNERIEAESPAIEELQRSPKVPEPCRPSTMCIALAAGPKRQHSARPSETQPNSVIEEREPATSRLRRRQISPIGTTHRM